ncbi:hypothetical protein V8J82_00840 [Gymnodinialimonas sp. 2305UL16-5]|uniref:hypothetical protein n=1 Tax=Gymnodinialimonas mytili TaxID=3126503 RepID=UPI0030A24256
MALDPSCQFAEGSAESCSHAVACIGNETLFVGRSTGWETGLLQGEMSNGASCEGDWDNAEGLANFTCDDDERGQVVYWFLDEETDVSLGSGATESGRPIEAWAGTEIAEYVERETGAATLQCGEETLQLR